MVQADQLIAHFTEKDELMHIAHSQGRTADNSGKIAHISGRT
jgi:hypothetical protein